MQAQNRLVGKIRNTFPRWLLISFLVTMFILAFESAILAMIQSSQDYQTGFAAMKADTIMPIPTQSATRIPTQSPTLIPTPTLGIGSSVVSEIDGMVMLYVPAGEFEMGSDDGDADESPVHTVYLDAYWIDQTEVTNDQYRMCVENGGCNMPKNTSFFNIIDYAEHPVVYVNWNDANDYCQWSRRELPTEAQWEKAARGTEGRTYPWGNVFKQNFVNCGFPKFEKTYPVRHCGGSATSPYGAHDMAGNVWEWVADWYDAEYYKNSPRDNPQGPIDGNYRVLRGGSWYFDPYWRMRSSFRYNYYYPDYSYSFIGFRCAQSAGSP